MNASAVDAVALRACRDEIKKLRADLRAILPYAEAWENEHDDDTAEIVCQRARKALNRRSP